MLHALLSISGVSDVYIKGQIVKILSIADHKIFMATIQLCRCNTKAVIDNIKVGVAVFQ